jgi:hypothetical protein
MGLFKVFYIVGGLATLLASLLILFGLSASGGQKVFLDFAYLGYMFRQIDPYFWSALGVAFAIGLSVLGAAWCEAATGGAARRCGALPAASAAARARVAPWRCNPRACA